MEEEISGVLKEAHDGLAGGHMGPDATTRKVLLAGLWWPTLHTDAREWVIGCDTCQSAEKITQEGLHASLPFTAARVIRTVGSELCGTFEAK